ncbi:MAG: hypothetical protein ABEI53_01715 [Candidatus Magasanikbacteria bacterium]
MKRKLTGSLIVLSAVLLSLFIVGSGSTKKAEGFEKTLKRGSEGVANFLQFSAKRKKVENPNQKKLKKKNEKSKKNLTNQLTNIYGSRQFSFQKEGKVKIENVPVKEFQRMANSGVDFNIIPDAFSRKDIKTKENNSSEAKKEYIEKIDSLLKENFKKFHRKGKDIRVVVKEVFQEKDTKSAEYMKSKIPIFINDLLEIEVPSSMAKHHINYLNLWKGKLKFYDSITKKQEDPLRAYLALRNLEKLIEKSSLIQDILKGKYDNLK